MEAVEAVVIIPHYNDFDRLDRCLAALMGNDRTGVEIVVVDNGSSLPLTEIQERYPSVRFLVETQKGAAAARNRGVQETQAPLLFFIDADCVAGPNWLQVARRVTLGGDLIGGRVDVFDETPPPRSGAEAFESVFAFNNRAYIERKGFSVTANLLTRRSVFDDVGEFNPDVSEDLDWCARARAKGYKIAYAPDLRVSHPTRSDWVHLRKKWARLTSESFGTNCQTRRKRCGWALRALAMLPSILPHGITVFFSAKLDSPGERARAFSTLVRLRMTRMVWMLRQAIFVRKDCF